MSHGQTGILRRPLATSYPAEGSAPGPPHTLTGRPIAGVSPPTATLPSDEDFYVLDDSGVRKPNAPFLKQHFFHEGRLTEEQALWIIQEATISLSAEPNLVQVASPVTICGDIHGQYYDLMKLFDVGGNLPGSSYLFLGDYVDRGCFGIECLLYLYALKLSYPTQVTLLRGNHECRHLTEYFTFRHECLHKYSEHIYDACIKSFCALPVTAIVDGRFFCVHGGISPQLNTLEDLFRLDRFQEPGSHGLLCDLLWSDPIQGFGHEQGIAPGATFLHNSTRGCSFYYTYEAVCQFLERCGLIGVIRGHEAQDSGYTMHRKTKTKKFPSVITIFSAPNYLDAYGNRGAVIKYANKNITIRQFNSSPHPYWLPNFMDAFTWSLPFIGEKIAEMLLAILSTCSEEELGESDTESEGDDTRTLADLSLTPNEIAERRAVIKRKIIAIGRMQKVFQLLREEAENASELSQGGPASLMPTRPSGPRRLSVSGNQSGGIRGFQDAHLADLANERLPDEFSQAVPSVRAPSQRRGSGDNINSLRRTLDEDSPQEGYVEKLADRIARDRRGVRVGRPLKRHETA